MSPDPFGSGNTRMRKGRTLKLRRVHWRCLEDKECTMLFWRHRWKMIQPDNCQMATIGQQSCSICLVNTECSRHYRHCRRKKFPKDSLHSQLRALETSSISLQGITGMLVDQERNSYDRPGKECRQQMKQMQLKKNRQGNHH